MTKVAEFEILFVFYKVLYLVEILLSKRCRLKFTKVISVRLIVFQILQVGRSKYGVVSTILESMLDV